VWVGYYTAPAVLVIVLVRILVIVGGVVVVIVGGVVCICVVTQEVTLRYECQ